MLANIEPAHGDFMALATYLLYGRTRPTSPDRVAWVIGRNIPTDDPVLAATYMTAAAQKSRRCTTPTYHMSINWRPDERPTPEIMQEIARRTLELAGLAEHQALVMGHGDKPHAHLHMMINRVHPDTGRAWSTSHDYARFDRIMKQLADDYGFLYVPGHRFEPELTDDLPTQPNSKATWAARRGAATSRPQGSNAAARELGGLLSETFDRATTWDDIDAALADYGYQLEQKGRGLVVGNASGYVRFSRLGLTLTANGLLRKLGRRSRRSFTRRPPTTYRRRHPFTVDAVDIARAIGNRDHVRNAVREAVGQRKARLARAPVMAQLVEELKETLKASTMMKPPRSRSRPAKRHGKPVKPRSRPAR